LASERMSEMISAELCLKSFATVVRPPVCALRIVTPGTRPWMD
jgi:hypothetical protein